MQTVVLTAGEGSRMGPLCESTPKPMLPVGDRPLVAHVLDAAATAGATRFVVVVGDAGDVVRSVFGDSYRGVPITYCEQPVPRGTADAVLRARPALDDEPFVVLNGDALFDADSLTRLYETVPSVGSYPAEDPSEYGVLELADAADGDWTSERAMAWDGGSAGRVVGVDEKPDEPQGSLVNAGAYAFPAGAQSRLDDVAESPRGEYELTDLLTAVCRDHRVSAVPIARWLDVGRPWELLEANEWKLAELSRRIDGAVSEGATLDGPVVIEAGAEVADGVTVEGPALVRTGASVGPNAYVRGPTLLGPDVHVGHAVEVKNSVLRAGTSVGHLSYVGDSVLGRDVNFGAGTVVANLRHDEADVRLAVKGERVSTGRRKFGVVVGDGVKTGIHTSIDAGVTLRSGTRTGVGENVTRDR